MLEDPFDAVEIAEDDRWARRHRVGYVAAAPVVHAHVRRFGPLFERTRALHRALIDAGELARVPDVFHLARALPSVLGRDAPGALGELLGQYAAARDRR